MKKIITVLLSVLMLFSLFGMSSMAGTLAASGFCGLSTENEGKNVRWEYDEATSTITISGTGEMSAYDGTDMPWFDIQEIIKKVVIKEGVTNVGTNAFINMNCIESVKLESGIKNIGKSAFEGCSALNDIQIGEGLETSGMMAFQACVSLEKIVFPVGFRMMGLQMFAACPSLTDVTLTFDATHNFHMTGQDWLDDNSQTVIHLVANETSGYKFKKWTSRFAQSSIADASKAETTMSFINIDNDGITAEYEKLEAPKIEAVNETPAPTETVSPKTGDGTLTPVILTIVFLFGVITMAAAIKIKCSEK